MQQTAHEQRGECPTPTAHRRLEEAHRLWHETLRHYQEPDGFRVYLNACIQALRNVTWALQKEKRLLPDFADWYPGWQQQMKNDSLMVWLLKSRNRIVKEGDLETDSWLVARLVSSYEQAADQVLEGLGATNSGSPSVSGTDSPYKEFHPPTRYTVADVLRAASLGMPARVLRQSSLSMERRWVDRALPDRELLDALARCYGFLARLLWSAHELIGVEAVCGSGVMSCGQPSHSNSKDGRPPCMVTSRAARTTAISMERLDRETGGKAWTVVPDAATAEEAAARYGTRVAPQNAQTPIDFVPYMIETGISILRTGEEHGWFAYLFKQGQCVHSKVLAARNSADKRQLAQLLAEEMAINDIDGLIMVGEAWSAPPLRDAEGALIAAADHDDRTEVLFIHAEDSAGLVRAVQVPFERTPGLPVKVGAPTDLNADAYYFMQPIRAAWAASKS